MEINTKDIRFGHLISHTFPGFILTLEIIIGLDLLSSISIIWKIIEIIKVTSNLIAFLGIFYVIATILGLIIDAIQHFIVDSMQTIFHLEGRIYDFYLAHKKIKTSEQLNIYDYFCIDNLWFYYECYANTAISLLPGIFILPTIFHKLGITGVWVWLSVIISTLCIIILIAEAVVTYKQSNQIENEFSESLN